MALTSFFGSIYLRYLSIPHYALGASGIRIALVTRGISGFVGVYGLYCKPSNLESLFLYLNLIVTRQ